MRKKRAYNEHGPSHVTPAGRSVFYDLGFDEAEARVLEMRADLMAALREHIEKKGWTQSEAAKQLGVTQPRVSALMKGAWRDFSADMLLVLAARLGLRPTLKLAA
jgi:predicted XRE-type DNA-binding protein